MARQLTLFIIAASFCGLLTLAGCGGSDDAAGTGGGDANPDVRTSNAQLPAAMFASAPAEGAVPLAAAKATAKEGDHVVFEARVGGRRDVFIPNRALFYVVDSSLISCAEMGDDDHCATPWDYCCEASDSLLANLATVRIVGDDGLPLKVSLENEHGLAPLKTVVISGTVAERDGAGNFVINAETIHVKG